MGFSIKISVRPPADREAVVLQLHLMGYDTIFSDGVPAGFNDRAQRRVDGEVSKWDIGRHTRRGT